MHADDRNGAAQTDEGPNITHTLGSEWGKLLQRRTPKRLRVESRRVPTSKFGRGKLKLTPQLVVAFTVIQSVAEGSAVMSLLYQEQFMHPSAASR